MECAGDGCNINSGVYFSRMAQSLPGTHMKHEMLRPIREKVGLGDPPVPYMNNPNESANAHISRLQKVRAECLCFFFCQKMRELVDSKTCKIERAFTMDNGPFVVDS